MYLRLKQHALPWYVLFFSFCIVSQLGKHFFFSFSYLSGIRIDYLAPTVYFTDILSLPLILIVFVDLIRQKKTIQKWASTHIFWITFSAVLITLNFALSPSKPLWLYGAARIIEWIFLFLFFMKHGKTKIIFSAVVWGLGLGSFFELSLSLLQLAQRHSMQGWWYYLGERSFSIFTPGIAKAYFAGVQFLRPYGTFSHPNSMGGFYLLMYAFILTQKRFTNVLLKGIFLTATSALILISFSRMAIIGYVLTNLIYFSRTLFDCRVCTIAKWVVACALLLFALNISGDLNSLQKRTDFFDKSLAIIAQKPLTGTGVGSYLIAQHQYPQKFPTFFEQPVHNIFLLTVAQIGIPLSLLLSFAIYRLVLRSMLMRNGEGGYGIKKRKDMSFILPLLCILITGSMDHYWITLQQNQLVFAVLFGILYAYEKKTP